MVNSSSVLFCGFFLRWAILVLLFLLLLLLLLLFMLLCCFCCWVIDDDVVVVVVVFGLELQIKNQFRFYWSVSLEVGSGGGLSPFLVFCVFLPCLWSFRVSFFCAINFVIVVFPPYCLFSLSLYIYIYLSLSLVLSVFVFFCLLILFLFVSYLVWEVDALLFLQTGMFASFMVLAFAVSLFFVVVITIPLYLSIYRSIYTHVSIHTYICCKVITIFGGLCIKNWSKL